MPKREQLHTSTMILLSLVLYRVVESTQPKFQIEPQPIEVQDFSPTCNDASKINLLVFRFKTWAFPLAFSLVNYEVPGPTASEYITDPGTGQAQYKLYETSFLCYMLQDHTGVNSNPLFIFVIQKDGSTDKCRVSHIVTSAKITLCAGTPHAVDSLVKYDAGASTRDSFDKIRLPTNHLYRLFKPMNYVFSSYGVADIDERAVEMALTRSLYKTPEEHLTAGWSYKSMEIFNLHLGHNSFAKEIKPSTFIPRLIQDDLPGYYLGVYSAGLQNYDAYYQEVENTVDFYARSMHIQLFMSTPDSLTVGKEHTVQIKSKPYQTLVGQPGFLIEYQYQIKISRTANSMIFKYLRGASTLIGTVTLPYPGRTGKFVYFSLTVSHGILYYKDSTTIRARRYETLHVYQDSTKLRDHHTFDEDVNEDQLRVAVNGQPTGYVWIKIEYQPDTGVTTNEAGVRVYSSGFTRGAYPPFLLSSRTPQPQHSRCYFPGFIQDYCHAIGFLDGPSDPQAPFAVQNGFEIYSPSQNDNILQNCKMMLYEDRCLIPKPGSISKIGFEYHSPLFSGLTKLEEYDSWSPETKSLHREYTNNLGTRYLVTCHPSCGSCNADLKCISCLDGASVNGAGLCPLDNCSGMLSCSRCRGVNDCAWCSSNKLHPKLDASGKSNCQAICASGFGPTNIDYQFVCEACPAKCSVCSTSKICTTCKDLSHYLSKDRSTCSASCQPREYQDLSASPKQCKGCPSNCQSCSGPSSCESCDPGFYKNPNPGGERCLQCASQCSACSSGSSCESCKDPNHFLQIDNLTCLAECPAKHFKDLSTRKCESCTNHCLSCSHSQCLVCEDFYRPTSDNRCQLDPPTELDYLLLQRYSGKAKAGSYSIMMVLQDSGAITDSVFRDIQSNLAKTDQRLMSVSLSESDRDAGYALEFSIVEAEDKRNLITIQLKITKSEASGTVEGDLTQHIVIIDSISSAPLSSNQEYALRQKSNQIRLKYPKNSESLLKTNSAIKTIAVVAGSTASTTEHGSLVLGTTLGFLMDDPNNAFMKISQYIAFIKRIKLIGCFLGISLEEFLEKVSGESIEEEVQGGEQAARIRYHGPTRRLAKLTVDDNKGPQTELFHIRKVSKGYENKLNRYKISIFYEGNLLIKTIIYDISWILKLVGIVLMRSMVSAKKVSKSKLKFLKYQRKIHISVLMASFLEISFFGTRILLHRRMEDVYGKAAKVVSLANILLLTFDMLWLLGFIFSFNPKHKTDKRKEKEEGEVEEEKEQHSDYLHPQQEAREGEFGDEASMEEFRFGVLESCEKIKTLTDSPQNQRKEKKKGKNDKFDLVDELKPASPTKPPGR